MLFARPVRTDLAELTQRYQKPWTSCLNPFGEGSARCLPPCHLQSAAHRLAQKNKMHFLILSGMSAMKPAFPVQPGGLLQSCLSCVCGGRGPLGAGGGTVALERSDLETLGVSPDSCDHR